MAKPKRIRGIKYDAAAGTAIRLVVTTRIGEMFAPRDKALDWSDPEGVYEMRVASRRLRCALNDFVPYLRKRRLSVSLRRIKNIADALGQVRDQDVAIIALDKLASKSPPEVSPGIQMLVDIRRTRRDEARAHLAPILDQEPVTQLQTQFLNALGDALAPAHVGKKSRASAQTGALTYREVARATILERLREFEKLSDSLYRPLKVKPLHELHIAAKRLRYALELFGHCWGKALTLFATRMADLQSELGEVHDCDIWIVDVGDDLTRAGKRGTVADGLRDEAGSVASLWLLNHFVKQRTKHYRRALLQWREWEANDFGEQLRKIVARNTSVAAITTSEAMGTAKVASEDGV